MTNAGWLALNWILFYIGFKWGYRKVRKIFERWNNNESNSKET